VIENEEVYVHREGALRNADEVFKAWTSGDITRMEKAIGHRTNPSDRHFLLLHLCAETHKRRAEPQMRAKFLGYARQHLDEFRMLAPALKREFHGTLPRVPSFQTLATVLAEDGAFEEAIEVCELALGYGLEDGTRSGFEGRITRIRRKQQQTLNKPKAR